MKEAAAAFRAYLPLRLNDSSAWMKFGLCCDNLNSLDEGITAFRKVAALRPSQRHGL